MNKRIVITGATGFVGSNLVKFFLNKGFEIYIIVRLDSDLKNLSSIIENINVFKYDNSIDNLIAFFKKNQPICTFHLASNFIAEHNSNQIDGLVKSNLNFGLHILEAMKEAGVKNIINTGTSWQHFKNETYNPVCLYAATKQAFEALIEYYVKAESFKVITLKLFDTYGETDTRPKLINLLNKFADEKTELKMSGGEQMLNLVHVDDVCTAFYAAFEKLQETKQPMHNKFAIANNKEHQLKEVISIFEKVSAKKVNIIWGGRPYRKREVMELWNTGEKLDGWETSISLEEGLSRYKS